MITRIIRASPVKVTGFAAGGQPFESSLEQDFYFLLRFRQGRGVVSFTRPDQSIAWTDGQGKRRRYTPDVCVELAASAEHPKGLTVLYEVKPDFSDRDSPKARLPRSESDADNAMKWAAATNFAVNKGWEFRVVRENEIRTPYLENVKFLIRAYERPAKDRGSARIIEHLAASGPTPLGALMERLEPDIEQRALLYPTLHACIADGRVSADLAVRLSTATVLSAAHAS